MKIGDWEKTMEAEREFWASSFDIWTRIDGLRRARDVYWRYLAGVILESLRCLGALPILATSPPDEARILEIGGGLVDVMRWFERGHLFAVEPLWDFFEGYRKRLSWEGLRTDVILIAHKAEEMPLTTTPVDIVLILNTLDHCEDPEEVMRRVSAVTKRGGLLYESTTVWGDGREVDPRTLRLTHPHLFKGDELRRLIERHGFEEVEDPYCGRDINEPWTAKWQEGAWPTYLRVWKRK